MACKPSGIAGWLREKKKLQLLSASKALFSSCSGRMLFPPTIPQIARMDIAHLIQTYGYLAVALGSFLEGEAVLLAGSLAAYHGNLVLPVVMGIAAMASFIGDLPYFFAGRRYGPRVLRRFPSLRRRKMRLEHLMRKHHVMLVLSLRFLYGMRIAGLLAFGMSRMSAMRFLLLDFIGAMVWSAGICAAGYGAGGLLQRLLESGATPGQLTLFAAILAGSLLLWIARRRTAASSRD
ncbi:MAG TPA: DedA family protein [Noviherbaspirillum sp.]|uniref:DedA family protein n=1 Tax=Noviherbaspirillum sp. TaxID=1926288 RepID=UPI002B45A44A|nr:DedA family protein [Noviherbaspirillum sp.]HJV84241.1 DedA family protein [Noviherbaspirillum sp.]